MKYLKENHHIDCYLCKLFYIHVYKHHISFISRDYSVPCIYNLSIDSF